jgi:hypothetical protein
MFAFLGDMTAPRRLASLAFALTLGSGAFAPSAAASSVGVSPQLRQKSGNAATLPKKKNPAKTPPRRRVVTTPRM